MNMSSDALASFLQSPLPMLLFMFVIFYFLLIRPQQQKQKEHAQMLGKLEKNDEIVTSSGMIRWDGTHWRFPPVYSDEPCLFHKVMAPPKGVRP